MRIAIPKETQSDEKRVAGTPDCIKKMIAFGASVVVETNAGLASNISDEAYKEAGASIADDFTKTVAQADMVLKIQRPSHEEIKHLPTNSLLVCLANARTDKKTVKELAHANITCFALELLPRISRAQNMDVLSSQSNLAGYKAVIDAVEVYNRAIPMMMTAAGTISPARVLVLGAGVAGLQAIATAKRLGAVVSAFDVRPSVKEQVNSLGAKFIEVQDIALTETTGGYAKELDADSKSKQEKAIADAVLKTDIIITTALIPGQKAPVLVTDAMLQTMRLGSVVFDLASEQGGNCEGAHHGKSVTRHGVTVLGYANVPSRLSADASALFAKNILNFITPMVDKETKKFVPPFEDEIFKTTCITHNGSVLMKENT